MDEDDPLIIPAEEATMVKVPNDCIRKPDKVSTPLVEVPDTVP